MRNKRMRNRKASAGMTMIEVLITLLVISIGLLGVAALHSLSLRNNHDALMRSHASALASEIADRMRANRDAVYVDPSPYAIALSEEAPAVEADSPQSTRDVAEWLTTLANQLPGGDGAVVIDVASRIVTITIEWGERGDESRAAERVAFRTQTEI